LVPTGTVKTKSFVALSQCGGLDQNQPGYPAASLPKSHALGYYRLSDKEPVQDVELITYLIIYDLYPLHASDQI